MRGTRNALLRRFALVVALLASAVALGAQTLEPETKGSTSVVPAPLQQPPQTVPSKALIYIYHRNSGSDKHPCCPGDHEIYLNGESLAEISDIGNYVTYEVTAPFPMSLAFTWKFSRLVPTGEGCWARPEGNRVSKVCPAVPVPMTGFDLHMQVEAGQIYYVQYTQGIFTMKLMKDESGAKDIEGLKLTGTKYIVPPNVEQAISIIDTDLRQADRTDLPGCVQRQPFQQITVTKVGLQFVDAGKESGFRKKAYSITTSMGFKGMSYLRMRTYAGLFNTLKLPTSDFTPKPGFNVMPCVERLATYDLPRFLEAVNRLIWQASIEADQAGANSLTGNTH